MKKVFVLVLATILLLAMSLPIYGDDARTTEVSYVIESSDYEITIPSSISMNANSSFPITLSECHSSLSISISSPNAEGGILRMRGINSGRYLNYSIIDNYGRSYGPYNPIILSGEGATFTFTPDSANQKLLPNDTYKDTLTFTIE